MEGNHVKVSVVIPIYNVELFIEECLLSVRNQTLQEIEIICVNDGTRDSSMEVVQKAACLDNRINIIHKKNGGLSTARNVGLMCAKGDYIYFLDSDDAILPDTLEQLYNVSVEKQLDNIYFGADTIYENKRVKRKYYHRFENYYHRVNTYSDVLTGIQLLQMMESNGEYRTSACLQMPRRQFLLDNHISFCEGILHEDNLFSLQTILCAERTFVIKDNFYIRRIRGESIMTAEKSAQSSWGYFVCVKQMLLFLKKRQYDDAEMRCIERILSVMQRDALYQIRNMDINTVDAQLVWGESIEDRILYKMLVWNIPQLNRQDRLLPKLVNKIKSLREDKGRK